jgi:hypothetical protein
MWLIVGCASSTPYLALLRSVARSYTFSLLFFFGIMIQFQNSISFFLLGKSVSIPELSWLLFSDPPNSQSCYSFQKLCRLLLFLNAGRLRTPFRLSLASSCQLVINLSFALCLYVRSHSTRKRDGILPYCTNVSSIPDSLIARGYCPTILSHLFLTGSLSMGYVVLPQFILSRNLIDCILYIG